MSECINDEQFKAVTGGWDYAGLPKNIRVGEGCFLERKESFKRFRSTHDPGLILGARVKVYTWTEFNISPGGTVEVGDDATLVGAIFMCAENIRVGRRVIISYNATIADSDFHPRDPELRKVDALANAPGGAQSRWTLDPDLTCLGKVIGGGLPVGAYAGKRHIMQHVAPAGTMYQAGTLSGNPLAMAAGIATLRALLADRRPPATDASRVSAFSRERQARALLAEVVSRLELGA